jgi:flagellar motor protein MotB
MARIITTRYPGNCALSAARAGGAAFVASMTAAGYEGLRVESRID